MKIAVLFLTGSVLMASVLVHADSTSKIPNLTDIVKDRRGHVIHMKQVDADQYCQRQGMRLPTIRELALWATQYGAKVSDTPKNGYETIDGTDSAGKLDTFYFQNSGYQAPPGELGQYWYWSSPLVLGFSNYAYGLFSYSALIDYFNRNYDIDNYFATRCLRSE